MVIGDSLSLSPPHLCFFVFLFLFSSISKMKHGLTEGTWDLNGPLLGFYCSS